MMPRWRCHHRAQHIDHLIRRLEQAMSAQQDAINAAAARIEAAVQRGVAELVPVDLSALNAAADHADAAFPAPAAPDAPAA